jgi:flagellar M-ring protein FliF
MQTLDRLSFIAPLSWFRAGMDRLWRAMMARRLVVRVGFILILVLGVSVAGYWAALALVPSGTRYLASGRSFSSEDVIKISQALDAKGISYRVDDRKVVVSAEQYDQAVVVFAKLHVGPMTFEEIRTPPDWWNSVVETARDKERNERTLHEKLIEKCIDDLDGVVRSQVRILYPRPAAVRRTRAKPSAFVYLETEPTRPLPSRTVQAICTILISNEPELSRESIAVMDKDHRYLDPSNPALGDSSRDQAREEDLRKEILEKLTWIKGVEAWVELSGVREEAAARGPFAAVGPEPSHADAAPVIGVNQPIELDGPAPTTVVAAPAGRAGPAEHGRVLINVPRSFYYNHMLPGADERQPTREELFGMAARTKEQIEKLVKIVVPESWTVDVFTIPDDVPLGRAAVLQVGSNARRKVTDWGIVAVIAASVALLTALASWIQAVRRPARSPEPAVRARRYRVDSGDEPNSSERVRELVRRDPEAAASVLQRWTMQGGRVS